MKIGIVIDTNGGDILVQRQEGAGPKVTLLECRADARTAEDVARLVAKFVGIAVAEAITTAAGGGE